MYADLLDLVKEIRAKDLDIRFRGIQVNYLADICDKITDLIVDDIDVTGHLKDLVTEAILDGLENGLESENIIISVQETLLNNRSQS